MSTIIQVIEYIDEFDAEDVIFAKPEWSETSDARIYRLTDDCCPPPEASALGFEYFLEVDTVRQVLEEFRDSAHVSPAEKCRRIIQYAMFDA